MKAAVYVGTRNLYRDMIPAIKALMINSDVDVIYLLIEDDVFPFAVPECVQTINVKEQTFFRDDGPNFNSHWTYMTLMRAALVKVLPKEVDRVLSMDDDVIALRNISDVWDLPIEDYYFAAADEPLKCKGGSDYTCDQYTQMGVVLFNLKKLREDHKADEVIKSLNSQTWRFVEQDCMNFLCQGKIYQMPGFYNVCNFTRKDGIPRMIHYAAIGSWAKEPLVNHYRSIPWREVISEWEKNRG